MSKKSDKLDNKPDHGTFGLHSPQESVMLVQLAERAQKNPQKPGHAWGRIQGSRKVDGRTVEGFKVYHVDLNTNRLTITEEWAGRETARKTIDLARSSFGPRALLYSQSWKTVGRHDLVIEVVATRGHKLVAIDELVVSP